jgi:hypothetical protein
MLLRLFLIGIPVCAVVHAPAQSRYDSNEISITNFRIIGTKGVLRKDVFEIGLANIESVMISQNLIKLLDVGTVIIRGTGGTTYSINK